jgi:hypothetical protein
MDERTPEKVIYQEVPWDEWHSDEKAKLSTLLGVLQALPTRSQDKDWDRKIIQWQIDLLQIVISPLWKDVRKLKDENKKIQDLLEKRDAEVTDILAKIQNWMKQYQPILERIEKEDKLLKKVNKK